MSFFARKFAPKPSPAAQGRRQVGIDVGLRLDANPAVIRAPVDGAQVYFHHDFLDAATCARMVAMIDTNRRPSTLLSDRNDQGFRTSDSCDMDRWSPDVQPIDEAIAALLGIEPEHGETMQGQRYAPGQQFRAHHDYFHESESYWERMQREGGQRTWTAMIYLNDVEDGGATWFPQAGIKVAPRRGLLLTWNNMNADGLPNEATIHEGMPVVAGVKYIITKWFRENRWVR
ncbi:2OG-Fe(II) oxygenase [Microvirga sp. SRT01]|uniref:2OG-Fe(II) oxygenase n=1 Tax=Sphingomonas longa TaxID=2778730 RepID=A0ABS2D7N4_9SPHN|nr:MULTISPECIES: 2OG-Fe(II) oxygenase [Alphaproteobacteria]MBM6576136.1 2OG-Fe(II) oxygenase [Sphingomonas sp. BT552]MBR7709181.1 2OG-Fe(II) oxygenase [Microvirga sp. SRT01]